jgi:multiple antibiotic resistance protein
MTVWAGGLMLYLILDPVGNLPLTITLLKDVPAPRRSWVIVRENLIALGVLLFFLFFGRPVLDLLGIEGPELQIAGGIVIFLISLRMIFPTQGGVMAVDELSGEPFIVPLAVPLLAGPSAIAVVMLFTSQRAESIGLLAALAAVLFAWGASLVTLLLGQHVARLLGRRGVIATERLMGMILCVIAVHIFMMGLEAKLK